MRLLIALSAAALMLVAAPAHGAGSGSTVRLGAVKPHRASSLVTFAGQARKRANKRVTIQRRAGKRWRPVASGRTSKRGRFALTWIAPSKRATVVVRAKVGGRRSQVRRVRIKPRRKGAPKITVSKKTRVISPSVVRSVPDPGEAGNLSYAGGNDIKKGAIVVIGRGDDTPNGFLGRVTDVERKGAATVAETVPATLQQAVPEGTMNLVAKPVTTRGARAKATISCTGSAGVSIEHDVRFTAGLDLKASWSLLDGVQSASLVATASADASIAAVAGAAGSCALEKTALLRVKGPSISGFVGPIPVVMTSDLVVYLSAEAAVEGKVSTGASAGFDASAGVAYTEAGGFTGIQTFTPYFGFDPPELSASATVGAYVTPTVDVLLYGLVGPQVALQTGVRFDADPALDPWWTLTVPVDLTASVSIPPLGLESPEIELYSTSFPLADAGGPFGTPPPAGVNNVATPSTSIAAGYDQVCALRSGAVKCWGGNKFGQLGDGTTTQRTTPVAVGGIDDAAAVVAANNHTCALRVRGEVRCWGGNDKGALGDGTTTGSATPVRVRGVTDAIAIATGAEHGCAVRLAGTVSCWGGKISNGSQSDSSSPVPVDGIADATAIAAGTFHTCALRKTGGVACWGNNTEGRLGDGSSTPSAAPVQVSGLSDAVAVSAGTNHACALRKTGSVVCWGDGFYGQLGHGSTVDSAVPVPVSGITDAVTLASGGAHSCAALSSGAVRCWGWNNYGQIGDGSTTNRLVPAAVSGITDGAGTAGGLEHSCVLRTGGEVSCWGYGGDGELGNGSTANSSTPVAVTGLN